MYKISDLVIQSLFITIVLVLYVNAMVINVIENLAEDL